MNAILNMTDRLLDRITMYRLLMYYLIALLGVAIVLHFFGHIEYSPVNIVLSASVLVVACRVANELFARVFDAPTNVDSSYITALILALIVSPNSPLSFLLAVSGLAMASKYMLAIRRKHIFNPAAIAVTLTALGPKMSANWWVGTAAMLPFVIIGGLLIVRKLQHGRMVFSFLGSAVLATVVYTILTKGNILMSLKELLLSSGLFFLTFVMLTEPLTTPPTSRKQTWYAVLTGLIFPPQVHILSLYATPELALSAGNIFSYLISPKTKLFPLLKDKLQLAPDIFDFVFVSKQKFNYKPGQYLEWTLPHKGTDLRGNRRYFTLASSPTEPELRIGVKFYKKSSSYKKALLAMNRRTPMVAAQLAGDFVLPADPKQKLAFIAGGIGVTPYRSMIKYLLDTGEQRSITLLYSARNTHELVYRDIFETARRELGIDVIYHVTDSTPPAHERLRASYITAETIPQDIPDFQERLFYISGTQAMVSAIQAALLDLGLPHHQIKTDFFPGYS